MGKRVWLTEVTLKGLPEKLRWARAMLNIHGALTEQENNRISARVEKIIVADTRKKIDG